MTTGRRRLTLAVLATLAMALPSAAMAQEDDCTDGKDNDGDTVFDCGDSDCKEDPSCKPDGDPENTEERCSDWVDNDENGFTDCDDFACQAKTIQACKGSWQTKGQTPVQASSSQTSSGGGTSDLDIPELAEGMTVEDLLGKYGDNDGERNDVACSDGVDNDNDGRTDCADFGCRFDKSVTVCQGAPDFRFSVVARMEASHNFSVDDDEASRVPESDARISTLQLRALGPLPFIQDSFFLINMRAEKTPRVSFAMFQVPLGKRGHYLNINTGSGGLSWTLVRSQHKRLLLDPAFFVYSAFEQGNGAALEVGGPFDKAGKYSFRSYISGGTGRFSGNVGGGFFTDETINFSYSAGAQVMANLIGYYTRWDSPVLYTPVPLSWSVSLGAKYDQRPVERFPAINIQSAMRWQRLVINFESYLKRELEFDQNQASYVIQAGFLVVPKLLLVAADFGEYVTGDFCSDGLLSSSDCALPDPNNLPEDIARQLQETQWRAAAHFFLWKNILMASVLYTDRRIDPRPGETEDQEERSIKAVAQYRF
ncbi:MAG: hypothetical protein KJO07_04550 [Deltaproteobacteria bacterium]|nr:hypothetical protein [Deltaproteobacteria bacterium]